MNKQRIFRRKLFAVILGVFGVSGMALAVDEVEQNEPIQFAQKLSIPTTGSVTVNGVIKRTGSVTVNGAIGNRTGFPDLADFYSFDGNVNDVVTIDIDGAAPTVDTMLSLFGPLTIINGQPIYPWLYGIDDAPLPPDPGSMGDMDARITYVLPKNGTYTVGVSSSPINLMTDYGVYVSNKTLPDSNGPYTLVISVEGEQLLQSINIEIKPGSSARTRANPKSKGNVPVALLSSSEFNALDVDVTSLTFGATGDEKSLRSCGKQGEDVNRDGHRDLVCHFENELAKFTSQHEEGVLKGTTGDGRQFVGRGLLKVVPEKRAR